MKYNKKKKYSCILATLIIVASYIPICISENLRFDSERMYIRPEDVYAEHLRDGRLVLLLFEKDILKGFYSPILHGVLFLLFFSMSALLLAGYLDKEYIKDEKSPFFFILLYGTSPIWAFLIYFQHLGAMIGLGIFLAVAAACLVSSAVFAEAGKISILKKALFYMISVLFLLVDMFIYQALLTVYLSVASIFFLLISEKKMIKSLIHLVPVIIHFIVLFILYFLFQLAFDLPQSEYLSEMILWDSVPMSKCLTNIIIEIGKTVFMFKSGHFSTYTIGLIWLVVINVKIAKKESVKDSVLFHIVSIGVLSVPFAFSILLGDRPVIRMLIALPVTSALLMTVCQHILPMKKRTFYTICMLFVVVQFLMVWRLSYTDYLRAANDKLIAGNIMSEIENMDTDNKSIIFIGANRFEDDSVFIDKTDVYGRSFFEWIYTPEFPDSATLSAVRYLEAFSGKKYNSDYTTDMLYRALNTSEGMPSYPDKGYVKEMDDLIIVHLCR